MRMKLFSIKLLIIITIVFFNISCETLIGPCDHTYEETILQIESVRNSKDGKNIETIVLSEIKIDSVKIKLSHFIEFVSSRVAIIDSTLICNPPCGFGTDSGKYSFRLSAKGFKDTMILCSPFYKIFKGGCPSSSNGGLRLNIILQPL